MTLLMGKAESGNALTRLLVNLATPLIMSDNPKKGLNKLAEKVEEELNRRIIIQTDAFTLPQEEVSKAVDESLMAVS